MKKLEFETSKGRFVVSDERHYLKNEFGIKTAYLNGVKQFEFEKFIELNRITEEQASEIVDYGVIIEEVQGGGLYEMYYDYELGRYSLGKSQIESLHSLLQSKGIHLYDNPVDLNEQLDCNCDMCYQKLEDSFVEAEEKTFYNPYIFKL